MNCRFLYAFKEDGDTFFGCIEKVFPHEIDLKMFEDIERGKGGFGVVKVARTPLPQCSVAVQSCYASGEGPLCRNMYFRRRDRREVQTVEDSIAAPSHPSVCAAKPRLCRGFAVSGGWYTQKAQPPGCPWGRTGLDMGCTEVGAAGRGPVASLNCRNHILAENNSLALAA